MHAAYVCTPYACNDTTCTQGESEIEAGFAAVESGSTVTDEQLEAIWVAVDVNGDGVLGPSGDNKVRVGVVWLSLRRALNLELHGHV